MDVSLEELNDLFVNLGVHKPKMTEKTCGRPPVKFLVDLFTACRQLGFGEEEISMEEIAAAKADKAARAGFFEALVELVAKYVDEPVEVEVSNILTGAKEKTNETRVFMKQLAQATQRFVDGGDGGGGGSGEEEEKEAAAAAAAAEAEAREREAARLKEAEEREREREREERERQREREAEERRAAQEREEAAMHASTDVVVQQEEEEEEREMPVVPSNAPMFVSQTAELMSYVMPQSNKRRDALFKNAKVLSKPPFKYIRQLVAEIEAQSDFAGSALFADLETEADQKAFKLKYLIRLVALVRMASEGEWALSTPLEEVARNIAAGVSQNETNYVLQQLMQAVLQGRIDWESAINSVLFGTGEEGGDEGEEEEQEVEQEAQRASRREPPQSPVPADEEDEVVHAPRPTSGPRGLARPTTAAGKPPPAVEENTRTLKRGQQEEPEESGVANVMGLDEEEDDDDAIVYVEEEEPTFGGPSGGRGGEEEQHGKLVENILQTQMGGPRTSEAPVNVEKDKRAREKLEKEIGVLTNSIQELTKAADPIGRVMEFASVDLNNIATEYEQWRNEYRKTSAALVEATQETERALASKRERLEGMEGQIMEQQAKLQALKARVLKNDEMVQKRLRQIVHGRGA